MVYPSILSHLASGAVLFASVVFGILYFSKLRSLDTYRMFVLLFLFSLVLAVHGISHLLLEKEYHYIPFHLWKLPSPTNPTECPCMKGKL